jgi:[ribosomal protein S5]-alanine N-acetyltransferase
MNAESLATEIQGCVLRPWRTDDKASLIRHANNRKVWRNLTHMFAHPYTEADADRWFALCAQGGRSTRYAIEFNGEAVGGIGLAAGSGIFERTAEFGYWLSEAHWGKGIVTAAARRMREFAFTETDFVRLEAAVFAWNPASMRVLEKAGFEREGLLKNAVFKDEQVIDSVMYAAVRSA